MLIYNHNMKKLILAYLLSLISTDSHAKNIKVVFRYDDFTLTNDKVQDSILQKFVENETPLVLGVIPFNDSGQAIDKMDHQRLQALKSLVSNGLVEIAAHGFNHKKNIYGEFKGLTKNQQFSLLSKSKSFLDSTFITKTVTFIPPWNLYDSTTIDVLKDLNFKLISSDKYGCIYENGISYLPHTIDNIQEIEKLVRSHFTDNVILVVMIHAYNFNDHRKDLYVKSTTATLDKVLKFLKENNVKCFTYRQLIEANEDLSSKRYSVNYRGFTGIISKNFKSIYGSEDYIWLKRFDVFFWLVFSITLLLSAIYLHFVLVKRKMYILLSFLLLASLFILIFIVVNGNFTNKYLLIIIGVSSLPIVSLIYLTKVKWSKRKIGYR